MCIRDSRFPVPSKGGQVLWPVNKNLKRKRVATKSLPEAWRAPGDVAGSKVSSKVEEFRQEWRKQESAQIRPTDLSFAEAWEESGERWAQLLREAKAYVAAAGLLRQTSSGAPKLWGLKEARARPRTSSSAPR
eukprot:13009171-Alexandrium_andersonii.AAC.1